MSTDLVYFQELCCSKRENLCEPEETQGKSYGTNNYAHLSHILGLDQSCT